MYEFWGESKSFYLALSVETYKEPDEYLADFIYKSKRNNSISQFIKNSSLPWLLLN